MSIFEADLVAFCLEKSRNVVSVVLVQDLVLQFPFTSKKQTCSMNGYFMLYSMCLVISSSFKKS